MKAGAPALPEAKDMEACLAAQYGGAAGASGDRAEEAAARCPAAPDAHARPPAGKLAAHFAGRSR